MGSRRRRIGTNEFVHSTLGKAALSAAMSQCAALGQKEAAQRITDVAFTEPMLKTWLWPLETLNLARAAKKVITGIHSTWESYFIGNSVKLQLHWNDDMIPLNDDAMFPNVAGQSCWELYEHSPLMHLVPLMKVRDQIQAISTKWQRAQAVINWLDRNATLGGFRYYLPSILQLCQSDVPQEMPSRFTEPLHVGPWVPLIREAQETIAASALFPDAQPARRDNAVQFFVEARTETISDDVSVYHNNWGFKV